MSGHETVLHTAYVRKNLNDCCWRQINEPQSAVICCCQWVSTMHTYMEHSLDIHIIQTASICMKAELPRPLCGNTYPRFMLFQFGGPGITLAQQLSQEGGGETFASAKQRRGAFRVLHRLLHTWVNPILTAPEIQPAPKSITDSIFCGSCSSLKGLQQLSLSIYSLRVKHRRYGLEWLIIRKT